MSDQQSDEKKEKEERRDLLSTLIWAVILIWAGIVFLAESLELLKGLELLTPWGLVFIGAGVIVFIEVLVRLLIPQYRRPVVGTVIFGAILIAVGLGNLVSSGLIWAIALIVGGAAILIGVVWRRR
jgi:hypothetical protein